MKLQVPVTPVDAARLVLAVGEEFTIEVRAALSRVVAERVEGTDGTIREASAEFELAAADLPAEALARLNG